MGWGGARVGAGKKPKPKQPTNVSPFSVKLGGKLDADDEAVLKEPPSILPADQQAFWKEHAPLAIERRTLTAATVPAFKLLCELHAKKTLVGLMVDKGALGGLRIYLQLCKQVESLMARFCLAPFGKPAKAEKSKPAANPWAQVAGQ